MESAEGIIDSIKSWWMRKKGDVLPKPSPGWSYEVSREYFLALSRGREFLLPIEEYPSRLELSKPWHEVFNQMRSKPYEEWVLIGFEAGQRRLVLPRVAEKGLSHSVPREVMEAAINKARIKAGITGLVGDAHSHPRALTSKGEGAFSLGDIYWFLYDLSMQRPSDPKRSVMFVTEGDENMAAFATKRSLALVRNNPINNTINSYGKFAREWYERSGWSFQGLQLHSQGGGEIAGPVRPDAPSAWNINKAISHRYQLALYRGVKDGPLLREYPARSTV